MTFDSVRSKVAMNASIEFNYFIEDILNTANNTMELISLIQSNTELNKQEAINYIIQCI